MSNSTESAERGEWSPTVLQLRNLYHKYTKMKSDPLAEDSLEMWVFGWAIKQLKRQAAIRDSNLDGYIHLQEQLNVLRSEYEALARRYKALRDSNAKMIEDFSNII